MTPLTDLVVTENNFKRLKVTSDSMFKPGVYPTESPFLTDSARRLCEQHDSGGMTNCETSITRSNLTDAMYDTCALVGNSGTLAAGFYGSHIDAHDVILRINQAPVKNYERIAGRKTTFRLINSKWVKLYAAQETGRSQLLPAESRNVTLLATRAHLKTYEHLAWAVTKIHRPDIRTFYVPFSVIYHSRLALQHFKKYYKKFARTEEEQEALAYGGDSPSTGFVGLYLLLQICNKVSVYGMMNQRQESGAVHKVNFKYHYFHRYIDSSHLRMWKNHSFSTEEMLMTLLEESNSDKIKVCGPTTTPQKEGGRQHKGYCGMVPIATTTAHDSLHDVH